MFKRDKKEEKKSGKAQAILYIDIFVNFTVRNFDRGAESKGMKNV